MWRRILYLLVIVALASSLWFINLSYSQNYIEKASQTFFALAAVYLLFQVFMGDAVAKSIKESRTRYSMKKAVSAVYYVTVLLAIISIWVEDTQVLFVSYGIVAAGLTLTLQDFFKNFVGGILLFVMGLYRVGDRIELEGVQGDVMDIGIMYTTLMEFGGWVSGDQATGRITTMPNGFVLSKTIKNYTKDHSFIWDEINLPITYGSDWRQAKEKILAVVREETKAATEAAEKNIADLGEKYYLPKKDVEPAVFLSATDNWINLSIRYTVDAKRRRQIKDRISTLILSKIEESENIHIASQTMEVSVKGKP